MCAIFTLWKGESKFTSDTFRTYYINILTVSLNGFLYDGKTKSGSFFIFATGRICLVKTFPYFIQRITRNADSVILDRYEDFLTAFGGFNCNNRVRIAEFNRIGRSNCRAPAGFCVCQQIRTNAWWQEPVRSISSSVCMCLQKRRRWNGSHHEYRKIPGSAEVLCVKCI